MSSGVRSASAVSAGATAAPVFPDFITLNHHSFALLAGFFLVEDSLMKTVPPVSLHVFCFAVVFDVMM
jgi:hypothetical protein